MDPLSNRRVIKLIGGAEVLRNTHLDLDLLGGRRERA